MLLKDSSVVRLFATGNNYVLMSTSDNEPPSIPSPLAIPPRPKPRKVIPPCPKPRKVCT